MAAEWHMMRQGKQYGPFTVEKLRELVAASKLLRNDLVWKQGMPQWVAAGTISMLFPPSVPQPPRPPLASVGADSGSAPFIQIDTSASAASARGSRSQGSQRSKKSTNYLPWILGGIAVLVVVPVGFVAMKGMGGNGGSGGIERDKNLGTGRISESQFQSVREGDSASDVLRKLGKPSRIMTIDEGRHWTYVVVKPAVDEYAVEHYKVWSMVFDRPETTLKMKLFLGEQ